MSTPQQSNLTTQVYRVYIKASPQAVWDAVTKSEWVAQYGYGGRCEFDLRPGGIYRGFTSDEMKKGGAARGVNVPDVAIEGEVIEVDEPHKLSLKWHMVMDANTASDRVTRLTYEIDAIDEGVTRLTLTHDLEGAPVAAAILAGQWENEGAGGGWAWVLSDLKSVLETGEPMTGG